MIDSSKTQSNIPPTFTRVGDQDLAYSENLKGLNGFRIAKSYKVGEMVEIIGYDQNGKNYVLTGTLDILGPIYRGKMEIVNAENKIFSEGMSGSAVLNAEGEVIGVLVGGKGWGRGMMEPLREVQYEE